MFRLHLMFAENKPMLILKDKQWLDHVNQASPKLSTLTKLADRPSKQLDKFVSGKGSGVDQVAKPFAIALGGGSGRFASHWTLQNCIGQPALRCMFGSQI